jgi:hypothetical protein
VNATQMSLMRLARGVGGKRFWLRERGAMGGDKSHRPGGLSWDGLGTTRPGSA